MSQRGRDVAIVLGVVGLAMAGYLFRGTVSAEVDSVTGSGSIPNQFDDLFQTYGSQNGVPWRWMKAIALNESDLGRARSVAAGIANPDDIDGSVSSDGLSWGLMQLTLTTARALEGQQIQAPYLNIPENSVRLASELLAQLISRFGLSDRESVIRAYNGGPNFGAATLPYYTEFVAHLGEVMSANPGDELEL